jgi:oligopeptide/dipeptide ABC transporter ATP-binding protein
MVIKSRASYTDDLESGDRYLLKVKELRKYFPIKGGIFSRALEFVHAVDQVNFSIENGETFGLVGESGCGKTTVGRLILKLIPLDEGKIYFDGKDLATLTDKQLRKIRKDMQIVFQDPFGSLDPRMTVKNIIGEPLLVNKVAGGNKLRKKVLELLEKVGLKKEHMNRYPHEFSGGQRQRICIARAIALNPKFLVLDEPTSALDVSVQAQILNLLKDLQKDLGLTYLFISHDLSVIKHMSEHIAVMYLGKLLEIGNAEDVYANPKNPYTKALMSATPIPNPEYHKKRIILRGEVSSAIHPPSGCRFHPRCPEAMEVCSKKEPKLKNLGNGRLVACHLFG